MLWLAIFWYRERDSIWRANSLEVSPQSRHHKKIPTPVISITITDNNIITTRRKHEETKKTKTKQITRTPSTGMTLSRAWLPSSTHTICTASWLAKCCEARGVRQTLSTGESKYFFFEQKLEDTTFLLLGLPNGVCCCFGHTSIVDNANPSHTEARHNASCKA